MLCENCGKNTATTHIKKIINGVATSRHLCEKCASEYGISGLAGGGIANMLSSMFGDIINENTTLRAKQCGRCGSTFREIVNSGKVGCEGCYTEFLDDLLPYIKRVHGSDKHIGKVPNNAPLAIVSDDELTELRRELHELVLKEEFEKAATVRDRIKELEKKVQNNG